MKNKKSLGQHWLKNRLILDEIADLARAGSEAEVCLEIGPGLGTLTSSLLRRFARVVAVEFDPDLASKLPKSFPGKNLTVVNADILAVQPADLLEDSAKYVVVGNIPYYITSPIVKKMLEVSPKPEKIVLLMQKEVAERIAAEDAGRGYFSLFAQNYATIALGPVVKAAEFTPPPKVDSRVLIMEPREMPVVSTAVLEFAKRGFSAPRKKLAHNLAGLGGLSKDDWRAKMQTYGIAPDSRPADLDLEDWRNLAESVSGR